MDVKRYTPCNIGRTINRPIMLGKVGEINALRIEFDCEEWLTDYPDAEVELFVKRPDNDKYHPALGEDGYVRIWIIDERAVLAAGSGVIELVLQDASSGTRIKSATGYTTVVSSLSAEGEASDLGFVAYSRAQNLTEAQKRQARNNIGAGTGTGTGTGSGTDGFSPTIKVEKIDGGNRLTITDIDGTKVVDVMDGKKGEPGEDGRGIESVVRTSGDGSPGSTDVYTITYTDGYTSTLTVYNGKDGAAGEDGISPTVAVETIDGGHRVTITSADSPKSFEVMDGKTGDPGAPGAPGEKGDAGRGISNIERTSGDGSAGTVDTYTIYYTDGTKSTYQVRNGADGKDGSNAEGGGTSVELDDTLKVSGKAADAKAVGDALNTLSTNIVEETAAREAAVNELNEAIDALGGGLNFRGEWNEDDSYVSGDAVIFSGNLYICVDNVPSGISPADDPDSWKMLFNYDIYDLPVATPTTLGGVQPAEKTESMTQAVGVDEDGRLWTASGAGGVYYNATEHGISAEADDNTPALQALMDAVHTAGGGVIWFPVGVYKFKKADTKYAVLAKSNVSIMGENIEKTVLKQVESAPYSMFYFMGTSDGPITGASYTNFTVDAYETGNTNQVYGKVFYYQYVKNCVFRDLILRGTVATAMGIDYLDQVVIDNVTCIDCGRTFTGTQAGTSGIGIGTGGWADENVIITNCVCVGCGQYGIFLENQKNLGWGGNVTYSAGAIISNCIVRNGLNKGIGVRGGENVTIIGCESYENASHGVYIDNKCKNVKVVSCSVTANSADGIRIEPDSDSNRVHVRDCTICDNTGSGVKVGKALDGITIVNSYTDGNNVGLSIGALTLLDAVIRNNTLLDGAEVAATFGGNTEYNEYADGTTIVMPEAITASDVAVKVGRSATISYSVLPDGASQSVAFRSTSEAVATVSSIGVVTGIAEGVCQIVITSQMDDAITKTINCTVEAAAETGFPITLTTADFTPNVTLNASGEEVERIGGGVSDAVELEAGYYSVTFGNFVANDGGRFVVFNNNGEFVSETTVYIQNSTTAGDYTELLKIEEGSYVRVSLNVVGTSVITINTPTTITDIEYGKKLNPDGSEAEESTGLVTGYVEIGDMTVLHFVNEGARGGIRVAQYDVDKNALSDSFEMSDNSWPPVDVMDGCVYIRAFAANVGSGSITRILMY